ncbi:uncharacterized protein K452DRAFT_355835 [Aplosporella prunicola CBS 121167]|uniref:Mitochondrial import inner membrane translocase subunit TIM54 n=1 Tax=Aplosporella prunicola CBS 121167 TaxID=1176127 RepID=A0A6A6BRB7_9PEZI|nr:uncharacterized protein K452DRAFT_355835 [Aplosporella prunicola CBS 121167]KAF2145357.1 hypothetical protein K452DRAFT_355835 [Aplosporella prunicola CBS 121167]
MADPSSTKGPVAEAAKKAAPEGNPALRMMGLPRLRLPSRNWLIFLGVTGSFIGAVYYDRHEQKKMQRKWCASVAHLASEPLAINQMPRRVTVYVAAPPADSAMAAREHFVEHVKPILVAAGLDWDAVEGRVEGDVRAQLAERIRTLRKQHGESCSEPVPEEDRAELAVQQMRAKAGIVEWPGVQGDIVIGRNTWKEYVRGLHEGWLGPLDAPPPPPPQPEPELAPEPASPTPTPEASTPAAAAADADDASPTATDKGPTTPDADAESQPADTKPAKRKQPAPYISPADYSTAPLSPNCPPQLPPSTAIPFPHILGFLNTPVRMYRFVTRRHLSDAIGAQVAAAVLAAHRPFASAGGSDVPVAGGVAVDAGSAASEEEAAAADAWEQQRLLRSEESEWHKSVRAQAEKRHDAGEESLWVDGMVLDARIAGRMRRFVLSEEERARVERVGRGEEA